MQLHPVMVAWLFLQATLLEADLGIKAGTTATPNDASASFESAAAATAAAARMRQHRDLIQGAAAAAVEQHNPQLLAEAAAAVHASNAKLEQQTRTPLQQGMAMGNVVLDGISRVGDALV